MAVEENPFRQIACLAVSWGLSNLTRSAVFGTPWTRTAAR